MSRALESEQNEAISTLDCHLEDIECGKYELVFTSAENVLVKRLFSLMKKTATPLHQSMPVCIKQIMAGKPSSAVVCCFQVSFTMKWKENFQID